MRILNRGNSDVTSPLGLVLWVEEGEKVRDEETKFPNYPFWTYISKINISKFWMHFGSLLFVHIWFTPSVGPKGFQKYIQRNNANMSLIYNILKPCAFVHVGPKNI